MASTQSVPYRPLGLVKSLLERLGFEMTHCYEDLVFVHHNAFLLRMEARGEEISLLFNVDSEASQRAAIAEQFAAAAEDLQLKVSCPGTYQMVANEEVGTLQFHFFEE